MLDGVKDTLVVPKNSNELGRQLMEELLESCTYMRKKLKYTPKRFQQMLADYGAVLTAKRLLAKDDMSGMTGLYELIKNDKPELSMEYIVMQEKYRSLFTDEEIKVCIDRLKKLDVMT